MKLLLSTALGWTPVLGVRPARGVASVASPLRTGPFRSAAERWTAAHATCCGRGLTLRIFQLLVLDVLCMPLRCFLWKGGIKHWIGVVVLLVS